MSEGATLTGAFMWGLVALGLLVAGTRRRSVAIGLVAAQALALGFAALSVSPGRSTAFLVASFALLVRALPLCVLLALSVRRTREPRPLRSRATPLARVSAVLALVLVVAALAPPLGLESRAAEQASIGLVAMGIAIVVVRRSTVFHLLGLLVAENGIALAAMSVAGGLPLLIEVGVAFDLVVVVSVATVFHERIFGEFGSGDTALLRSLRDDAPVRSGGQGFDLQQPPRPVPAEEPSP